MISRLGVSKAVLDNVIFCHQENSYWYHHLNFKLPYLHLSTLLIHRNRFLKVKLPSGQNR